VRSTTLQFITIFLGVSFDWQALISATWVREAENRDMVQGVLVQIFQNGGLLSKGIKQVGRHSPHNGFRSVTYGIWKINILELRRNFI
jgi:hypothetical protein